MQKTQLQQLSYLRLTKMLQGKKQKEIKIINERWQGGGNRPTNVVG